MVQAGRDVTLLTDSTFPVASIERAESRWEEHIWDLSPVERHGMIYFKREDKFAPLGRGGINGSKLRQLIWLVSRYVNKPGAAGLISGASVKSPQLSMGTAVATHFGLPSIHVIGATNPESATKHENVAIANWLGARFHIAPVAYNPFLQRRVRELLAREELKGWMLLEYGITLDHKQNAAEGIEAFHRVGSEQVKNIPDDIETLLVPAGSCNSCTSILYGIARFRPAGLKRVILFGIGPNRIDWLHERLRAIERASGVDIIRLFRRTFRHNPEKEARYNVNPHAPYELLHYDLHGSKFASYSDEMPCEWLGIAFHPTYEGKIWTYIRRNAEEFRPYITERTCFWIVGSKPTKERMMGILGARFGAQAPRLRLYV